MNGGHPSSLLSDKCKFIMPRLEQEDDVSPRTSSPRISFKCKFIRPRLEQEDDVSPRTSSPRTSSPRTSSPRVSFQRNGSIISSCLIPPLKRNGSIISIPTLISDALSRKSLSYTPLPQEPLKLTVIKLDGTSFDIELVKTGTVAQLKQAVEEAFSHLPTEGPGMVSWSFVWGHFCLCYDGQNLLNDTDDIGCYGIKDGDKLQFIRHASIGYNMVKKRPEAENQDLDEATISEVSEDGRVNNQKVDEYNHRDIENQQDDDVHDEDGPVINYRYKWVHLFRGWFAYSKLPSSDEEMDEHINSRSDFLE